MPKSARKMRSRVGLASSKAGWIFGVSSNMRIVSFLPSATEIVGLLGLAEDLVGVSHECDYPSEVKGKPVVVRCAVDMDAMSARERDVMVSHILRDGGTLYKVD